MNLRVGISTGMDGDGRRACSFLRCSKTRVLVALTQTGDIIVTYNTPALSCSIVILIYLDESRLITSRNS
jgi:hypothetical protein